MLCSNKGPRHTSHIQINLLYSRIPTGDSRQLQNLPMEQVGFKQQELMCHLVMVSVPYLQQSPPLVNNI